MKNEKLLTKEEKKAYNQRRNLRKTKHSIWQAKED